MPPVHGEEEPVPRTTGAFSPPPPPVPGVRVA